MNLFNMDNNELLEKIGEYGRKAGRVTTRPLLLLYFVWKSPETPRKDKQLILLAFAYLLLPIDLIPSGTYSLLGLTDEAFSIWTIYKKVKQHITPAIEWEVDKLLEDWFPETRYEILPD